ASDEVTFAFVSTEVAYIVATDSEEEVLVHVLSRHTDRTNVFVPQDPGATEGVVLLTDGQAQVAPGMTSIRVVESDVVRTEHAAFAVRVEHVRAGSVVVGQRVTVLRGVQGQADADFPAFGLPHTTEAQTHAEGIFAAIDAVVRAGAAEVRVGGGAGVGDTGGGVAVALHTDPTEGQVATDVEA